jgi:hypothetical protein
MSKGGFKHELFTQFARIRKVLSNANRRELLEPTPRRNCSVASVRNSSRSWTCVRQKSRVKGRRPPDKYSLTIPTSHMPLLRPAIRVTRRALSDFDAPNKAQMHASPVLR